MLQKLAEWAVDRFNEWTNSWPWPLKVGALLFIIGGAWALVVSLPVYLLAWLLL